MAVAIYLNRSADTELKHQQLVYLVNDAIGRDREDLAVELVEAYEAEILCERTGIG
ncbi:hypothetical protein ACSMXN_08215 [Jatrophihabitans sp. DSM 45814]